MDGDRTAIPIDISIEDGRMSIAIERLAVLATGIQGSAIDELEQTALYLLARLLETEKQNYHASSVARRCLERRLATRDDQLAAYSCIALLREGDSAAAVELALANGLHAEQCAGNALVRMVLASPSTKGNGLAKAIDDFYSASIKVHADRGEPVGALRYSYASNLRVQGRYATAIRYYNTARKDDPRYLKRPYFPLEVGGMLFLASKFTASVAAYRLAYDMDPQVRTAFCLGDAQLYAGLFTESRRSYEIALGVEGVPGAEARLKTALANWAIRRGIERIHGLDTLFHIRAASGESGDAPSQFWSHLAITFWLANDEECWSDAIFLALVAGDIALLTDVLEMAVHHTGLEAFAQFKAGRHALLSDHPEIEAELDRLAIEFNERGPG